MDGRSPRCGHACRPCILPRSAGSCSPRSITGSIWTARKSRCTHCAPPRDRSVSGRTCTGARSSSSRTAAGFAKRAFSWTPRSRRSSRRKSWLRPVSGAIASSRSVWHSTACRLRRCTARTPPDSPRPRSCWIPSIRILRQCRRKPLTRAPSSPSSAARRATRSSRSDGPPPRGRLPHASASC